MFFRRKKTKPAPEPPEFGLSEAPMALPPGDAGGTTQFLTGDSQIDRRSVEVLLEAIAGVSGTRDLESLLSDIVDRSIEVTGAERGLLIMESGNSGEGESPFEVRVARDRSGAKLTEDLRFSTSIASKVLEQNQPVRATVQSDSDALELGRSVFDLKLRAVMCVPLKGGDSPSGRGVLYVDSKVATREFDRRDLGLFAALSQHISIALEQARLNLDSIEKTRLENSLELASAIQSGLMPRIPKDLADYEIHGWYRPAEQTSGDFYDFLKTKEGQRAVVIGDVTGHGIGPALVTASAQASLRSYLKVLPDLGTAMTMLNADLAERLDDGMFITLLLAELRADGNLRWINAGQSTPMLWRKTTGKVEMREDHGMALGFMEDTEYTVHEELVLEDGDVFVTYTDGLIELGEVGNPDELFGEERLAETLARAAGAGKSAEEIALALAEEALGFAGGKNDDDVTIVVVKRSASA